jgi:ribulose-5-phosphate 4-epimerase/fuculose-1-phosphate aldolase
MKTTMRLQLVSGAIALVLGAGSVWGQANPTTAGPVDPLLLEDLALSYRILTDRGIMDGLGHSSMRHPANPKHYLISRNRATGLVTPADLMELDLDSRPVDPNARTYQEVHIHAEIYKLRPDVNAVIHHHAPGTVSWGMGKIPMMPMNQSSRWMLDGVPFFDYRDIKLEGDKGWEETNLIHTAARGRLVAQALGASPALLLVNHGAVVVGSTITEAVGRSIYMEINTEVQTAAMLRGGQVTYYDAAGELRATGSRSDFGRQWDLWKSEACAKAGFCNPELANREPAGRGGRGAAGRGAGGRGAGGRGGREGAPRD